MGSDKKLLLQHLPAKLKGAIKPQMSDTVIKLLEGNLKSQKLWVHLR